MPAGEQGGDTRKWCLSTPGSPPWGMFIFKGFILGGEGISSLSRLSVSSIKLWKNSLMLVEGNRMEHLEFQIKNVQLVKILKN